MDVGNLSKTENGVSGPPQKKEVLLIISKALNLSSKDLKKIEELATHEAGKYPEGVSERLLEYEHIPLLLRTIANKKLTDEEIKELTKQINSKK